MASLLPAREKPMMPRRNQTINPINVELGGAYFLKGVSFYQ
jgi:hypothetical protein